MGTVICITSQKGGVGKTTTAVNLSTALAIAEKRTLLIDCDPQGHATLGMGIDKRQLEKTLYHGLLGLYPVQELILQCELDLLHILPARAELLKAEIELKAKPRKEWALRDLLQSCRADYDFIVIDSAPALNLLTVNAIVAADSLLIPLQCELFAVEGLLEWMQVIQAIRKKLRLQLQMEGILLTMYVKNELVSRQIADRVQTNLPQLVFRSVIPRDVPLRESALNGKALLLQDLEANSAREYLHLAEEIIARHPGRENQKRAGQTHGI
ncbi:MAG: ParA family protein [Desulfobacteraceae bacterium]|nr:MAG: ParA family protein [Desulfobacteraceae bacterium]